MRADAASRPAERFEEFTRLVVVGIVLRQCNQVQLIRIKLIFDHRFHAIIIAHLYAFVKYIIPQIYIVIACISISLLAPIATLFVGLSVAYIARQQWKVSHAKLRLDLFDRRYKVYEATRQFLGCIMRDATFSDSQLFTFYAGTSDAEFLFDREVVDYHKEIAKRAIDMRLKNKLYQNAQGDERTKMIEIEHQHLLWLTNQLTDMTKIFTPYLGFSKIR
jgi:hypothetical protein